MQNLISFFARAVLVGLAAFLLLIILRPAFLDPTADNGSSSENSTTTAPSNRSYVGQSAPLEVVSYAAAVERAAPAVVNIYTAKILRRPKNSLLNDPLFRFLFGDQPEAPAMRTQNSLGSGVLMGQDGYLLTNHHVVKDADEIEVLLADGRATNAEVIGVDPESDLAVLQIALEALPKLVKGESDRLRVGDVVLAIGNPFGVGQTVTQGIVSATGRNRLGLNTFENFIQTDAAINPGNSGGALINAYGELIGINTAIFSRSGGSQGIGFAIPVNLAQSVLEQIIEHGRVVRGWLGVEARQVAAAPALDKSRAPPIGVSIFRVQGDGPADRAGLLPGDLLTHIDGAKITHPKSVLLEISRRRPGERLELTIERDGTTLTLNATLGERPNAN